MSAFLAALHNRSRMEQPVDPAAARDYPTKVIHQLATQGLIGPVQQHYLEYLRNQWDHAGLLEPANQVLIHGDTTPMNFIFGANHEVVAIDLERMRPGDAATDLGFVIG